MLNFSHKIRRIFFTRVTSGVARNFLDNYRPNRKSRPLKRGHIFPEKITRLDQLTMAPENENTDHLIRKLWGDISYMAPTNLCTRLLFTSPRAKKASLAIVDISISDLGIF